MRGLCALASVMVTATVFAAGCGAGAEAAPAPRGDAPPRIEQAIAAADADSVAHGASLFVDLECARCHARRDVVPEPERDCAGCHRTIHEGTFSHEGVTEAMHADFRGHVRHLLDVPALDHVDGWLRRAWIAQFLLAPHDLRPALEDSMPALPLTDEEATALAAYLAPSPMREQALPADPATITRGRERASQLGCQRCHAFGDLWPAPLDAPPLAPDLVHARARLAPSALVAFLLDPSALRPDTTMPRLVEDEASAIELAAFLLGAPVSPPPPAPPLERLPLLERAVSFDEIEARVFRRSCWHCHADQERAYGDGGPGNTGGFGFEARDVDLSSYAHVMAGARDHDGAPASLFRDVGGEPLLVRVLLARHDERRGILDASVRGMPLGLPPLEPEQIQLVESWIAQGRPR